MTAMKTSSALMALMLAGCGGDDGGSAAPPSTTTPTPATPTLGVTLSATTQTTAIGDDGAGTPLGFTASVAGTTGGTVIADLQYDRARLALDGDVVRAGDGSYKVQFKPVSTLALGNYNGTVTFRLCRDTACATVYPGSTQTFGYNLTLQIGEWTTYQRNAAHTGYVHATFDPAAFVKAWEYAPATATRVSGIAAANGLAYVTTQERDGTAVLHALATGSGDQRWSYAIGATTYFSTPAVGNGRVFVTTMTTSSNENPVISVDAVTGDYAPPRAIFSSQWSSFLQPTPYKDGLYMSAGYYGSVVYGFDYTSRTGWEAQIKGSIWDGETPAVDDDTVYYYSGNALEMIDRRTGEPKASLADPFFQNSFYSYYGAPVLGTMGNVMAYSSQRSASTPSILVNWSTGTKTMVWRSASTYSTAPAVGGGRIYLSRANPGELNALDEATGRVLWGWAPPLGEQMIGNTILTDTLVFVCTNKAIYAIPTQGSTHTPVWSAAGGGDMALTSDGTLIVTGKVPDYGYPRALTAYRLR
jgi:outer membrane protein assembly factor BamB